LVEFKKDLSWWNCFLTDFNGVSIIPDIIWSNPDANMSTDICLKSCGSWCGTEYFSKKIPKFVLETETNVVELLTILVGLKIWGERFRNLRIQNFCDNSASVVVLNSGKTKDPYMLKIIREIAFILVNYNFQVKAVHLAEEINRIADRLSRAPIDPSVCLESCIGSDWKECHISG